MRPGAAAKAKAVFLRLAVLRDPGRDACRRREARAFLLCGLGGDPALRTADGGGHCLLAEGTCTAGAAWGGWRGTCSGRQMAGRGNGGGGGRVMCCRCPAECRRAGRRESWMGSWRGCCRRRRRTGRRPSGGRIDSDRGAAGAGGAGGAARRRRAPAGEPLRRPAAPGEREGQVVRARRRADRAAAADGARGRGAGGPCWPRTAAWPLPSECAPCSESESAACRPSLPPAHRVCPLPSARYRLPDRPAGIRLRPMGPAIAAAGYSGLSSLAGHRPAVVGGRYGPGRRPVRLRRGRILRVPGGRRCGHPLLTL